MGTVDDNYNKCSKSSSCGEICCIYRHLGKLQDRIEDVINHKSTVADFIGGNTLNHVLPLLHYLKQNPSKLASLGLSTDTYAQLVKAFVQLAKTVKSEVGDGVVMCINGYCDDNCQVAKVSDSASLINGLLSGATCVVEKNNPGLFTLEGRCSSNALPFTCIGESDCQPCQQSDVPPPVKSSGK
jgi:hypothetical protein